MFAEGALSSAFVPVFKEKLIKQDSERAFKLANTVFTAILVFVGSIVLLGMVAAPAIVYLTAKGFTVDPVKFDLTVNLTRFMFIYLLLVSLSALVMGMLNSFGRFGIPAIAPAMFNLGMIFSTILLFDTLDLPVYALAIGVIVGGLGQLAIQLPTLVRIGFRLRFSFDFLNPDFKRVIKLFTPMVMGMSAGRINMIVSTLIASFLIEGSITYLNYAYRLMHFPLGVFAVAIGTVALPRASELVARGELERVGETYIQSLKLNLAIIMPAAAFLALMGHEMVSLIYEWGAFSQLDSAHTSLALLHYSYGLIGFAAVRITVPIYYALGNSRTPMRISIFTVLFNMALYYPMVQMLSFAGLAAATSLASLMNISLLLYFLSRTGVTLPIGKIYLSVFRFAVASLLAVYIAGLIPYELSFIEWQPLMRIFTLLFKLIAAGLIYSLLCFLLGENLFKLIRGARGK